jgi:hypothetical protein
MILSNAEIQKSLSILTYIRKDFNKYEDINDSYYHILKDLLKYPKAWAYFVWSKRGPGKTYSALWMCYYNDIRFIYMKRTNQDVNLILKNDNMDFDASPYKDLKLDKHLNVVGVKIDDGIGAYYEADAEGEPHKLLCYVLSFNKVQSYKGFGFADCEFIIFDEVIPQKGERVRRSEGENLLDLYMTVSRDRQKRGRSPLKILMFANAEEISTPVTKELEIVDDIADMNASGQTHMFTDRKMLLHHITNEEVPITEAETEGIYEGMKGTAWFDKAFGGYFSGNDFSNVSKRSIRRSTPLIEIIYRKHSYYIYYNEEKEKYYMCSTPAKCQNFYNLDRENDQKRFYYDFAIDLREACMNECFKFEKYSMYDLIINYRKNFDL